MPYSYNLSDEAEDDMFEAYCWYEKQRAGLGEEFLEALEIARETLLKNPATYRIRYKHKVRGFIVHRFPFIIHYIVEKQEVNVLSIFRTSRDPEILVKRIK